MDTFDFIMAMLVAALVGAICWIYGVGYGVDKAREDAVEAGAGEYRIVNSTNGTSEFFFKTNCN